MINSIQFIAYWKYKKDKEEVVCGVWNTRREMYIWKSIKTELTSEQILDYQESEYNKKRENVYAFLRLPWALEKVSLSDIQLGDWTRKLKLFKNRSLCFMGFFNVPTAFFTYAHFFRCALSQVFYTLFTIRSCFVKSI